MKNYEVKITDWQGNAYRCGGPERFTITGRDNRDARARAMSYIRDCGIFNSRSTETLHRAMAAPRISVRETDKQIDW